MNNRSESDDLDPEQRVREIKDAFRRACRTLNARIAELEGDVTAAQAGAVSKKLSELETAHVALVKAEEAFREKTKQQDSGVDYQTIRDQIGRALDRIRNSESPGDVSKEPE